MSTVKANTIEPASGGTVTITGAALTTPALGTAASGTLTNCTGLPASTGLSGTTLASSVVNASINAITPSGGTLAVTGAVSLTQNVIVASGKGIDFSANSNAAGMTSELFSRYEEGTWTTNDSSGAGLSLTITGTSTYTRIGRQVLLITDVTFPATADTNLVLLGGLPFTTASGPAGAGSIGSTDYGAWITAAPQGSGTGIRLVGAAGFLTNANLSGKRVVICLAYIV